MSSAREVAWRMTGAELYVTDVARMAYLPALELQRSIHARILSGREDPASPVGHLLLVEHDPPVITVSRRKSAPTHLLATPELLAREGVEVCETDRGGDITYHGPGQLIAYPILDLNRLGLNLHAYMRLLEQVVIEVCAAFGVAARRDEGATGVWVDQPGTAGGAKVCAMGVRVRRWVTMHGLALNVTTNLEHFRLIVPCGLAGRPVTSLRSQLGEVCPPMDEVKGQLISRFAQAIRATTKLTPV